MATLRNRQRQQLRTNPLPEQAGLGKFFGKIGEGIWQGVKGIGDFGLGLVGAPDIIDNSFIDRSKFLSGANNVLGTIGRTAANIAVPGLGSAIGAVGRGLNQLGVEQPQASPYQNQQFQQPFGSQGFGNAMQFLPGLGSIGGLLGQISGGGQQQQSQGSPFGGGYNPFGPGTQVLGQTPFGGGFGTQFNPGFGGGFGGFQMPQFSVPGFAGGQFGFPQQQQPQGGGFNIGQTINSIGSIANLLGNLGVFGGGGGGNGPVQKGGYTRRFQTGGLVDIQAEKDELIFHPTGHLTPVHAKRTHSAMEKSGDEDVITDHPLDGSFIFSDFLKIKKSHADDLVIGVKRYPYEEGKAGKEPEVFTVGDLFNKREKKKTPAELAKRVSNIFKVTNDKTDIFNVIGDQFNIQNRMPYLQGVSMLSEIEKEKDDVMDQIGELEEMIFAKKGGKMRSRRVYHPLRARMAQFGGGVPAVPQMPTFPGGIGPIMGDPNQFPQLPGAFPTAIPQLPTIPTTALPPVVSQTAQDPINQSTTYQNYQAVQNAMNQLRQQQASGQMMTQFVDQGSPFLRGFGQAAIPIGGAINFGSNIAGAIGSYNLNNKFIDENRDFFAGQSGLANQARDIASAGNMFDIGLGLTQQGPVDREERFSSRLRQFNPYSQVNTARQLADQSLGQINSMVRNNPNNRGLNIGSAIAQNNQSIAQARNNAVNQQFQIDQMLDAEDYFNQNVRLDNQQRRVDFGNSLVQGMRPGFQGLFSNEASRPLDQLGLNSAERQADVIFRQNRLQQPLQYLSTAGNSLANLGASALSLGTNYVPTQVPMGASGQGGGFGQVVGGLGNIASLLGNLGVFGGGPQKKGGSIRLKRSY